MASGEKGSFGSLVLGFIIGAVLMAGAAQQKFKEAEELQQQNEDLQAELEQVRADASLTTGEVEKLRQQVESAKQAQEQHERELALVEQKAQVESRLAGIEEGKAIAEKLIDQLVRDKEESSQVIAKLNDHMDELISDLQEQLASVELLVEEQSGLVSGFGWTTLSLVIVSIIAVAALSIGAWSYIRFAESVRDRHTVAQVIGSGVTHRLFHIPSDASRRKLIAFIENDLKGGPSNEASNEFRFESNGRG
ncbi:MAG: hypothetical protein ABJZ55_15005 [Fuerstiella sp.]